jgi:hypothetical protein
MHSEAEKLKEAFYMPQVPAHLLNPLLNWPAAIPLPALLLAFFFSLDCAASLLVQASRC